MKFKLILAGLCFCCANIFAVCITGHVEVTIAVHTHDYANEGYWELIPAGNPCGIGTIFFGGNTLVGCNGGGLSQSPPGGYNNNLTVTEGPWCLTQGSSYDILFVDDWGDGGLTFDVFINGFPMYRNLAGSGDATGSRFTFIAQAPPQNDVSCRLVKNPIYVNLGNVVMTGWVENTGSDTVHSVDLSYSINNAANQVSTISGLNISPFDSIPVSSTIPWNVSTDGIYNITMWANQPNGNTDANSANDTAKKNVTAGPGIPNIIDDYIGITPVFTVIGSSADSLTAPRDLDFHPILSRYELWVILEGTELGGGSTAKFSNAGQPNQTILKQKDSNARHFMDLPTGIAFSENGNFSTSPGVYDANHSGGVPFTGPTLWSSDSLIYAHTPPGGNGSHIDMLHQSPYSMGICSEKDNIFWVFDDNEHEIVRYDFVKDHGPGNSDHSDGIIRRFSGLNLAGDPNHEIPSHLVLKKETGMLYFADTHNHRILKMDIHSGTFTANLIPYESLAEYSTWAGATVSVVADSGLSDPSGIDLIDNRLIVSDYLNGNIIIYDIATTPAVELGRIATGAPGIEGIKIGPDGKIWYVNVNTNQVIRIDGFTAGNNELVADNFSIYPNPASTKINVRLNGNNAEYKMTMCDPRGSLVMTKDISKGERESVLDVSKLSPGVYTTTLSNAANVIVKRFVKE